MTYPSWTSGEVLLASDMNAVGMWRVIPTSVTGTGATITSGTGQINLNATPNVTINGIWSANYENYVVVARITFGGGDLFMQVTTGGTPAGGTSYNYSMMQAYAGAGVTTARTAGVANHVFMSNGNGFYQSCTVDVFAPFLALPTMFQVQNLRNDGAYGVPANYLFYGNNVNNTSYDGLRITSSGNMTGTISVYGRKL